MDDRFEAAYPHDSHQPEPGIPPLPRNLELVAFAQPPGYPQSPGRKKAVGWLAAGSMGAGVLCVLDISAMGWWALLAGPLGIALAVAALIIGRRNTSLAMAAAITGLVLSAVTFLLLLAQLLIWLLLWGWYLWGSDAG